MPRYRFEDGSWISSLFINLASVFPGDEPAGMAFGPGGGLYISMVTGDIRRCSPTGACLSPNFANAIGNGKFKIAVGILDGLNTAIVANRNGGEVLRFRIAIDPSTGNEPGFPLTRADAEIVADQVEFPVGVALASNATPAITGQNIAIEPCELLAAEFDQVDASGFVSCTVHEFRVDERGPNQSVALCAEGGPGCPDADLHLDLGLPAVIPPHVVAFPPGVFALAIVESTAQYSEKVGSKSWRIVTRRRSSRSRMPFRKDNSKTISMPWGWLTQSWASLTESSAISIAPSSITASRSTIGAAREIAGVRRLPSGTWLPSTNPGGRSIPLSTCRARRSPSLGRPAIGNKSRMPFTRSA